MQQKTPEDENLWLEELYSQFKKLSKMQSNALKGILEGSLPVEEWLAFFATIPALASTYGGYRLYRNKYPFKQPNLLPVASEPGFFSKLFMPGKAKQMQTQFDLDTRSNQHILSMFKEDQEKHSQIMDVDAANMQKSIGEVILFISTLKDDLKKGNRSRSMSMKKRQKELSKMQKAKAQAR